MRQNKWKKNATRHAILSKYNTTFKVTKAALHIPPPEGGWETIVNCKNKHRERKHGLPC